ncbi:MAG: hypothetical protein HKN41_02830 [Ilumatobacter sp.]|nr:hypothetical protein [Ilumatobacter sp.]
MTTYVLSYHGEGEMPDTPEGQAEVMAAWNAWFAELGDAVVDGGNPYGDSRTVASDGSITPGNAAKLSGYSVVQAGDLDAAAALAKGCPILGAGGSITVSEVIEM